MNVLASFLVGKPHHILLVAFIFWLGYLVLRSKVQGITRHSRPMFFAAVAWSGYAAWEWLVLIKTPEANIRVDLILILPVLAALSVWALFRSFR